MFDRDLYWESLWTDSPAKGRLFLDYPYVKAQLLDDVALAPIRQLVFELFARTLDPVCPQEAATSEGRAAIMSSLNATTSFSLAQDLDAMTQLDTLLTKLLREMGLLKGICGMQFPVTVRASHPAPPLGYVKRDYATDHFHCDPWAGEPTDLINCFMYIQVDSSSSCLELLLADREHLNRFSEFNGAYALIAPLVLNLQAVPYTPANGQLIVFDSFTPHRTVRQGSTVRLSIDFRLRREDPYAEAELDERWDKGGFGGQTYWYPSHGKVSTFAERCEIELSRLRKKGGRKAISRRIEYIEKLTGHPYTQAN